MMSFRRSSLSFLPVLVFCGVTVSAFATSFVVPSDTELIAKSDAIVRGVVASTRVVESDAGFIETVVEITVTRRLKGDVEEGAFLTVSTPGGNAGGRFLLVDSAARFRENEDVLLFLTSQDGRWTPTDMTLGKFRPALTTKGYSVLVRDEDDITGWTRDGRPHLEKVRLEADFVRFIENVVRGQKDEEPYDAQATEVLAAPAPGPRGGPWQPDTNAVFPAATYSSRFVTCETTVPGRWPSAVMDAGVPWFKNDANDLDGADDGGVAAIQAGLASWTSDAGSAIHFTYAGAGTALARDDAENTFVFNDPQNLIPGHWTGSGVIATTWLYAAGSHAFDGEPFLNIAGADIVFQDGYTAGEPSLDAAIRHEIGHAIGFRHSNQHFERSCTSEDGCAGGCSVPACDPDAEACATSSTMSAVMSSAPGSMHPWDIRAAHALYPAANAIPQPPTNVLALASTGSAVFVSWSASNGATSYSVFRSDGGAYVYLGDPTPPAATSYLDEFALPNKAYVYRVQAHNGEGSSDLSGGDIATTVIYTDPTLTAGMRIKAVHLTELRTAANLLYALGDPVNVPAYTDPTIVPGSTTVKALHFEEVEYVLLLARTNLGLSVPSALGIVSGAPVPTAHITALRTYAQ